MIIDWTIAPITAALSVLVAIYLYFYINKQSAGTAKMQEISNAIEEGARAFLKVEFKYLTVFVTVVAVVLAIFLILLSAIVTVVTTGEDNEQTYLISWNSYIDMEINTSPFNKPLEIGVSHTLPINISYWTDIPAFFRKIPSLITNNFLFGQSAGQVQELHIEALNTPSG